MTDLLTYLPIGMVLGLIAMLAFTPFGTIVWGLLSTSPLARKVAAGVVLVLGVAFASGRLRAAGRREGRAGVDAANAAARADRERIERDVSAISDSDVDRELGRWSR